MISAIFKDAFEFYFSGNEIRRGRQYHQNNQVLEVKIREHIDFVEIEAKVSGTAPKPYHQNIGIFVDEIGPGEIELEIQGACSCPVGYNCKHVVAVICSVEQDVLGALNLMDTSGVPVPFRNDFGSWLAQATQEFVNTNGKNVKRQSNDLLVYEVHNQSEQLNIEVVKTRRLKSGELSKAPTSSLSIYSIGGAESYLLSLDLDIISALKVCALSQVHSIVNHSNGIQLIGRAGSVALDLLLRSKRLYLDNYRNGQLLTAGNKRSAKLKWTMNHEGYQQLRLEANGLIDQLFNVDPLMALDSESGKIFPVNIQISNDQIFQLISAPVLSPAQSREISDQQRQILEQHNIPTPLLISTKDVEISSIKPVLTLEIAQDGNGRPCSGAYGMRLSILYNELQTVEIPSEGKTISWIDGNVLLRCQRDSIAEAKLLDQIISGYGASDLSAFFLGHIPRPGYLGFENPADWYQFMHSGLDKLKQEGWLIEINDDFNMSFDEIDEWHTEVNQVEGSNWFDLELGIEVDGKRLSLLPILLDKFRGRHFSVAVNALRQQTEGQLPVYLGNGKHVLLPHERLIPLLETFVELFDNETDLVDGKLTLSNTQSSRLIPMANQGWQWQGGKQIKILAQKMRNFKGIKKIPIPEQFKGSLRDYQQQGVNWLQFTRQFNLGPILSDDMGLGKTVQTLAHLCVEKVAGRLKSPCLIVAPTSLMTNWRQETIKFAPSLSLLPLHGQDRSALFEKIDDHDLVLTSYALVMRDIEVLRSHSFHYLILDESQKIKNPRSKSAQLMQTIDAKHRLCLTGTPMENHLGELWAQFNFLMPGFLGDEVYFNHHYRKPIEKQGDHQRRIALHKRISPVLLRRTKELVASELPPKTEIIQNIQLSGTQRDLYETIRLMMHEKVRKEISNKGMARSHIMILDALLKLRQVCCHPQLLKLKAAKNVSTSAKLDLLMEMLPELVEEGRRILLFSQFTSMLAVIETLISKLGINYVKLTGKTRDRDTPINQFQDGEVPIFLISLKAGGMGLNLTRADTVIHYDPWWNPAVEDQATDRAHRIGQDKPVFIYKFIAKDTVESKILEMQERKRQLAKHTLDKCEQNTMSLTEDDLVQLFSPLKG